VTETLVLWDIDHTLVDAAGVGREAYDLAFARTFGREPAVQVAMAGRTDRAIAMDLLRANGVHPGEAELEAFRAGAEALLDEVTGRLAARGRALPGALEALVAFGAQPVVQSLLTGNIRLFAEVKLRTFGLYEHVDADLGGYGWTHAVRAHLVDVARAAAADRHGRPFAGRATVLVGDTPLDVEAALARGAAVVAVATGRYSAAELESAGAHAVLPDLTRTDAVLDAVRRVSLA
jgi:phosphoglycolate phosphatase